MSLSPYSGSDSVGRGKKLNLDSQQLPYMKKDLAKKSRQVCPLSVHLDGDNGANREETIINPATTRHGNRSNKTFPFLREADSSSVGYPLGCFLSSCSPQPHFRDMFQLSEPQTLGLGSSPFVLRHLPVSIGKWSIRPDYG